VLAPHHFDAPVFRPLDIGSAAAARTVNGTQGLTPETIRKNVWGGNRYHDGLPEEIRRQVENRQLLKRLS